jgi:hypothetical protein
MMSSLAQRWVWVTGPNYYAESDGSDRRELRAGYTSERGGWWTCDRATRKGDLALLYRTSPRFDLKYLFRAESDAYEIGDEQSAAAHNWDYGCDYSIRCAFRRPLKLFDLRSDPVLKNWGVMRSNFRRRVGRIPDDTWDRLVELITEREPDTKPHFFPALSRRDP